MSMKRIKAGIESNLTQFEVAPKAEIRQQQVSCLERGFMVSKPALQKLCDCFGLTNEGAFEDVDPETVASNGRGIKT